VSTDNDWATKRAFPIGQWLGLARSQRELSTLGNYQPYFTHTLAPSSVCSPVATDEKHMTEDFTAAGLRLTRLGRGTEGHFVQAHNPFVVASTTKSVIDGHNGIWSQNFGAWLREVIATLEKRNEQRTSAAPPA
jgi:hypothetical protein